jgi:hypothetical protein
MKITSSTRMRIKITSYTWLRMKITSSTRMSMKITSSRRMRMKSTHEDDKENYLILGPSSTSLTLLCCACMAPRTVISWGNTTRLASSS